MFKWMKPQTKSDPEPEKPKKTEKDVDDSGYEYAIRGSMRLESICTLSCGMPDHIRTVHRIFIESAQDNISLLSHDLSLYEDGMLVREMERAVRDRNVVVTAVLSNDQMSGKFFKLLVQLAEEFPWRVEVFSYDLEKYDIGSPEFCVVDSRRFRWDPKNIDDEGEPVYGTACCNSPKNATELRGTVEHLASKIRDEKNKPTEPVTTPQDD